MAVSTTVFPANPRALVLEESPGEGRKSLLPSCLMLHLVLYRKPLSSFLTYLKFDSVREKRTTLTLVSKGYMVTITDTLDSCQITLCNTLNQLRTLN